MESSLVQTVATLENEARSLEEQAARREADLRAPAVAAEAELSTLEIEVAEHEERLAAFNAELDAKLQPPVLTPVRGALVALSLGVFMFGAAASDVELTRVSVGLFAGMWIAFLAGALRGR